MKDLTGRTFGSWSVLCKSEDGTKKHPKWDCLYECGTAKAVHKDSLVSGRSKSCGCVAGPKPRDNVGDVINGITLAEYAQDGRWKVIYKCGHHGETITGSIRSSKTGLCFPCMAAVPKGIKHGLCGTRTYGSWMNMQRRCYEETNNRYEYYGSLGITVSEDWLDFDNFVKDMGICPDNYSIERKDLSLGYSKENCIWADNITQANNKTSNILIQDKDGKQWSLRRWCELLDLNYKKAWHQLRNKNLPIESILGKGYTVVQMR